jgi:nitrate reductase gamma subunit
MTALLFAWIYFCLLASLAACAMRAARYARAPLHLRWELYPVPHEEAKRAAYGGSRYEETDWWTRPARPNRTGDLRAMASEILFLKGVREANRPLWFVSYPFHSGLYLLAATGVLLSAGAVIPRAAAWLHPVYAATGICGVLLVLAGAVGLLVRRITDPRLRNHTTPGDVLNLLSFISVAAALLVAHATRPPGAPGAHEILRGLLTFDTGLQVAAPQAIALALAAGLVLYIPLTHMAHFIGKYFTYHAVRWDDAPNRNQPALCARIAEYLAYRPTWSAPHVGANGQATWADVAAKNPADAGGRK